MSRRMLDSSVWGNEKFAALAPLGRLLQIGMINAADDQGRLKAHPVLLSKEIFPYDTVKAANINKWLGQMASNGTIILYTVEGKEYAQFVNWWKYQILNFAMPSTYPAPEGWQDRIRFNGKGNITLTHHWIKADGEVVEDTCDVLGNPLPFVDQLPRKNLGGRPSQQGKIDDVEKVRTLVPTIVPTLVDTIVPTKVHGKVNKEYDYDQVKEGEEKREAALRSAHGANAPAPSSSSKDHPLIKDYHLLHNRYPSRAQMALIIEHDPAPEDWRRAIRAWAARGHNPVNVEGQLDWALDLTRIPVAKQASPKGLPSREERKTGYNDFVGEAPPPDEDKLAWRAEMTRAKLAKGDAP